MTSLFWLLQERLAKAITTLPNYSSLLQMFALLTVYGLLAICLGFSTNFLYWDLCKSKRLICKITASSLIAPALLEETIFRILLLPYPLDSILDRSLLTWSLFSLLLFVVYHPLNGLTFFPQGQKTFTNPIFLCLATGLGIICTLTYWQSGSLWLSVFVHWLVVVIWLLCLGGATELNLKS